MAKRSSTARPSPPLCAASRSPNAQLAKPIEDALARYTTLEAQRAKVRRRIPWGNSSTAMASRLGVQASGHIKPGRGRKI